MRQDLVLLSMFAGLAVVVLPVVFVFFLALGPAGWLFTGVSIVVVGVVVAAKADDDADETPAKTNCPECGSRVQVNAPTCDYCGHAFDGPAPDDTPDPSAP
ncbi:hypothetical protein [Halobaculum limi]|uniref:hypothetical protein n=1 Tax=Halobaculum limi TaxID=3031916 RepID=UPI002407493C|nr:hypothetical protein [Halobaculum sp. YSMS11]